MKKSILLIIILFGLISCKDKEVNNVYESQYYDIIREMAVAMDQLGNWDYSPNGKDSIWETTDFSYNLTLLKKVKNELPPIIEKWDSLWFLSKKYDSIPYPSERLSNSYSRSLKRKNEIFEREQKVQKLVDAGMYDENGKELKSKD